MPVQQLARTEKPIDKGNITRKLPIGAEITSTGVHFRVWAPRCKKVEVVVEGLDHPVALAAESGGHFSDVVAGLGAGGLYRFRLDESDALYPDPASRCQPQGVHGPSEVVDSEAFKWTDQAWKGTEPVGQVLYEMHFGTLTREGTYAAAIAELPRLTEVGITCLEVMPVADFPGDFGWGYDGVDLFAPARIYGRPDDLRRFVDAAHALGLSVILDVVYNHFGPDGNYLKAFSDHYFTTKHKNDWGESLNFDDVGNEGVREFFVANARYWISEFHFDGFRFDATQAILDDSPRHVLAEICEAARAAAGEKQIYLITENEPQETRIVRPACESGYGFDALWNDDFHHSAMVQLTGRNEGYFLDYLGRPQEFISALKWGYLYQGQLYRWQGKCRGTSALDLLPKAFVNYIQNHDQIANYGHGQRAHQLASAGQYRAMTALLLLAPQTPLLFQGQEYAASNPFRYFADHEQELSELIYAGRLRELSQFVSSREPAMHASVPRPTSRASFEQCKLNAAEREHGMHKQMWDMHKELLRLRREEPALLRSQQRGGIEGAVLGGDAFLLRFFGEQHDDLLLLINFGRDLPLPVIPEPLLAAPFGKRWEIIFSTESPKYGGAGTPPLNAPEHEGSTVRSWRLPGRCALLARPAEIEAAG